MAQKLLPVGFKSWNSLDVGPITRDTSPVSCMVKNATPYENLKKKREKELIYEGRQKGDGIHLAHPARERGISPLLLFLPCLAQTLLIPRASSDSQKYQHKALCPKNPKYFLKAATKLKAGLSSEAGNY